VAAGAAVAGAASAAATSNAYSAGVAAGSASTAAATTSAYNAGVAAGVAATGAPAPAGGAYVMGQSYASLPAGCMSPSVQGKTYYLCGNTWFQPAYGANGVFYRVVPTP
jgi:hypothetical protein